MGGMPACANRPPDSLAGMLPIASRLEGFGAAPDDTDDERLAKATLATASLLIVPSAAVWGTVFLLADRPLAALAPSPIPQHRSAPSCRS